MALLEVRNLNILKDNCNTIVKGVDLDITSGEWFSLIGKSGSGKTLTALSLIGLLPQNLQCQVERISFDGKDLAKLASVLRGREISYVFQDYNNYFTPYITIEKQLYEFMVTHTNWDKITRQEKIALMLKEVGLTLKDVARYSFQLSGGQLQRVALTLSMLLKPKLLIADEPTTALDAVNAKNVLALIDDLRKKNDCAVLFITHDLRCVKRYADRIAIINQGVIVEKNSTTKFFKQPQTIYARELLDSILPLTNF